jgi:hypothetical protein
MSLVTDPMTAARGILKLISETVAQDQLTLAYQTLDLGYPRDAILYALVAARDNDAAISSDIRKIIFSEVMWPADEQEDVSAVLNDIPLLTP